MKSLAVRSAPGEMVRLKAWVAILAAALGGALLDVATPGLNWWPAAFLGVALVLSAVWHQRASFGLLTGSIAGACFWLPHISWLTLYLGPIPWLALGTVMTAWFGLFGLAVGAVTRGLARLQRQSSQLRPFRSTWFMIVAQSLVVAGLWVTREQLQSSWPYGGFAWGRLAHTQAEGPLAELVSWLGFSGLSGFIALASALPIAAVFAAVKPWSLVRLVAVTLAVLLVLSLVPVPQLERTGTLRVAAVQGNAKAAIFDDRESGDVLRDHVEVTERLISELEATGESVDVIVWPENSAEFNIPANGFGSLQIGRLAKLAGTPIVVGSILPDDSGNFTNSTLVWGAAGEAPQLLRPDAAQYDKRHPVPFAEYMPHRSFYRALVPELVDLVQLEYSVGERPAAVSVPGASGAFMAGLAICFDIIFDDQAVAMVDAGAEVIFAQTNNADFGHTDESAQQLQIAKLRGIETGRALVNISTVGTSAIMLPDGTEVARLKPYTADFMVAEVPLVSGQTPALTGGAWIAGAWIVLAGAGVVAAAYATIGARLSRRQ